MLTRIVPMPTNGAGPAGTNVLALNANTSRSGRLNGTTAFQSRPNTSSHWPVGGSNFTIRPVSGAAAPAAFVLGPGRPPGAVAPPGVVQDPAVVKPSQTADSWIAAVWLPEWKAPT